MLLSKIFFRVNGKIFKNSQATPLINWLYADTKCTGKWLHLFKKISHGVWHTNLSLFLQFLNFVSAPIISNTECNAVYGIVGSGVICISTKGGKGTCNVSLIFLTLLFRHVWTIFQLQIMIPGGVSFFWPNQGCLPRAGYLLFTLNFDYLLAQNRSYLLAAIIK